MDYKIAIIGSHEEILGFKSLGLKPISVSTKEEAEKKFQEIIMEDNCAIIFITENWAVLMEEILSKHRGALPAVVTIPNYAGSQGLGEKKLREIVERAVGSDILFKDKK